MKYFAGRLSAVVIYVCLPLSALAASAPGAAPKTDSAPQALPPAHAMTEADLAAIDGDISVAEALTREMESLAKGGPDGSGCPVNLDSRSFHDNLKRDLKSGPLLKEIFGKAGKAADKSAWSLYYLCLAIATKDVGVCADLPTLDFTPAPAGAPMKNKNSQSDCAAIAQIVQLYRAYDSSAPGFLDTCVSAATKAEEGGWASPAALRGMCRAVSDYKGNPESFIAAARAARRPSPSSAEALQLLQEITGDPKACAGADSDFAAAFCRERVDARKAAQAKDPKLCGGGLCSVMIGGPAGACDGYKAEIRKSACKAYFTPRYAAESTKAFTRLQEKVTAALNGSNQNDLKLAKAVNERLEKLYALRGRFDAAATVVAPATPIAVKPAAR
jgi:hypothetical protein